MTDNQQTTLNGYSGTESGQKEASVTTRTQDLGRSEEEIIDALKQYVDTEQEELFAPISRLLCGEDDILSHSAEYDDPYRLIDDTLRDEGLKSLNSSQQERLAAHRRLLADAIQHRRKSLKLRQYNTDSSSPAELNQQATASPSVAAILRHGAAVTGIAYVAVYNLAAQDVIVAHIIPRAPDRAFHAKPTGAWEGVMGIEVVESADRQLSTDWYDDGWRRLSDVISSSANTSSVAD